MATLKTRIAQKTDTQVNWEKAINFIPNKGEVILYQPDSLHPKYRMKIGDGETAVNNLPFVLDEDYILSYIDNNLNQTANSIQKVTSEALERKENKTSVSFFSGENTLISEHSFDSTPFISSYDKETGTLTFNSDGVTGDWSIFYPYTECFSYEFSAENLAKNIIPIFAQDDTRYYSLNISYTTTLDWFACRKDIMKDTGKEYATTTYKRNTYLERNFEPGEKLLVTYTPNISVTVGGSVINENRYTFYRQKITDVSFRQFMVFDLATTVTPVLGFYSYIKVTDAKIHGLYIDVNIPKYPVYDGYTLINNGKNDYVLKHSAKKWLAIGDSITGFSEASYNDKAIDATDDDTENSTYGVNYIHFVEAITGYQACRKDTGNNYGYSGYAIAGGHGKATLWSRRTDWDNTQANVITFFAGTNDYQYGCEIGIIDDYINNTGINTIYGALRLYIDYFKEKGIDGELDIVLITPIQRFNEGYTRDIANAKGYYLEDYVNAIKAVGAYESIKVIDLYNNGGIGSYNYTTVLKTDNLHPNKQGYEIIAKKISEGLTSTTSTGGNNSSGIQIDAVLDAESENPVQNKHITSHISSLMEADSDLAFRIDNEVPIAAKTNNHFYETADFSEIVDNVLTLNTNYVTYISGTTQLDTLSISFDTTVEIENMSQESVLILDLTGLTYAPVISFNGTIKWLNNDILPVSAGRVYMFSFTHVRDTNGAILYSLGIGGEFE